MPANFTKEERETLIQKFYEQGYALLRSLGYKNLKISDITASLGIGTGTFYHFFKSKDEFILWLIRQRKQESLAQFLALSEEYPTGIPIEALEKYLYDVISNYNIYRCLSQRDYNLLQKKYALLERRTEKIAENGVLMMERLATSKTLDDFKRFAEAYTILIIGTSDQSKLDPDFSDQAIKALIHSACQLLY